LEGNTRTAARAFAEVSRLSPNRIDGPLNLARTAIQDGNIAAAYRHLLNSEALEPGNPRAAWVWGVVSQEDGRYDEAILAYRRVLEEFPGDRAAWRNVGRSYYLSGQYEAALSAYAKVLEIDPEDRTSHYHRMLCYRALGRDNEAELAAAAYEYYSIDESAQAVTRTYRLKNPGANLMAQPVRTHVLVLRQPGTRVGGG
jgi:tetratricopeptide (TPR) repeat protein